MHEINKNRDEMINDEPGCNTHTNTATDNKNTNFPHNKKLSSSNDAGCAGFDYTFFNLCFE